MARLKQNWRPDEVPAHTHLVWATVENTRVMVDAYVQYEGAKSKTSH